MPITVTLSVWPRLPLVGAILASVGAGLMTLKALLNVAVPPPGAALVTEMSRKSSAASRAIVMFTAMCVALLTVVEFSVMPAPKLALLTPSMKSDPVKVTLIVSPRAPVFGLTFVSDGAGFPIVNASVRVAVPPPGAGCVTVTFREPVAALAEMLMFTVICVELSTVIEFTVMSGPKLTELRPARKFDPRTTTESV